MLQEESPNFQRSARKSSSSLTRVAILMFSSAVLALAVGCSATNLSSSKQSTPAAGQIQVAISPASAALAPKAQERFTATVRGTSNTAVTWSASAGSILADGTFTSPATSNGTPITISAVSAADPSQHGTSLVTIQAVSKLSIATSSLSQASVNTPYSVSLSASGGVPPYSWATSGGSIAPGMRLAATTGAFTGTPTKSGNYPFSVKVTDASSNSATQSFTLAVSLLVNANFDGPAELPRVYLNTQLANTPAPGSTITVKSGGDLQGALDSANCGDTITLQAGATFTVDGRDFTLPAKACDDQHWIIVRTSTADASLPPEGTRMTPCYAGVASLKGRPVFPCANPQQLLATITYTGVSSGPLVFANGANHYRLIGLEITRAVNNGKSVVALISAETSGSMNQIVLDRLYIHGTPTDETRRGVALSGGTNVAVQDSYISDFHCAQNGSCTDSQAVSGGGGSVTTGPIRIVDNFLEAAGENILFGGSAATQTPADIEIRFNHLFKPMFWLQGQPGFVAPSFIVKNHFELKNAQRVLFDSNVLEDTWGGFSQAGFSILLTAKNQGNLTENVCPLCQVTDVTVRNVTISHVAGAFQIANCAAPPLSGVPLQGQRFSIHDVIVDDIDRVKYAGNGTFAQVSTIAAPLLQNVSISHITAFPSHTLLNVGGPNTLKMPGFNFTNSIVTAGEYPVWSTGQFQNADCANADVPLITIEECFSGSSFSSNAILSASSLYPASKWPAGNWFYASPADIGFVNYQNGNGGDYHLLPTSPAKGAASDGKDLGADVNAVLAAVNGAR
jgi:Putative Ig domain